MASSLPSDASTIIDSEGTQQHICAMCHESLGFIATFQTADGQREIAVYSCQSDSGCDIWNADYGCNLAIVSEPRTETPSTSRTILGSYISPIWIQYDETPDCNTCGVPMRFALSYFESGWTAYLFENFCEHPGAKYLGQC